jgi:ribonuclease HII
MTALQIIFGIDEAGRGPLSGPVVAACVTIPHESEHLDFWRNVTDSKKLSAKKREMLFPLIQQHSIHGIAQASATEIDELNIHHATLLAMRRAFDNTPSPQQGKGWGEGTLILVDGKFTPPNLPCPAQALVNGDSLSLPIAAASILAKVTRDRIMADLHRDHPEYGWIKNAGYGTAEHLKALQTHGITPHHRLSFAPVRTLAA